MVELLGDGEGKRLVLDEDCERGYRDFEEVVVVDVRPWKGVQ